VRIPALALVPIGLLGPGCLLPVPLAGDFDSDEDSGRSWDDSGNSGGGGLTGGSDWEVRAVSADTANTQVTPGQDAVFRVTVENRGSRDVDALEYDIYYSTNISISDQDTRIASRTATSPLLSGESTTYTMTLDVPSSLESRTYYFGVIVDPDNDLAEGDEDDNTAYDPAKVTVSRETDDTDTGTYGDSGY